MTLASEIAHAGNCSHSMWNWCIYFHTRMIAGNFVGRVDFQERSCGWYSQECEVVDWWACESNDLDKEEIMKIESRLNGSLTDRLDLLFATALSSVGIVWCCRRAGTWTATTARLIVSRWHDGYFHSSGGRIRSFRIDNHRYVDHGWCSTTVGHLFTVRD